MGFVDDDTKDAIGTIIIIILDGNCCCRGSWSCIEVQAESHAWDRFQMVGRKYRTCISIKRIGGKKRFSDVQHAAGPIRNLRLLFLLPIDLCSAPPLENAFLGILR